VAKYVSLGELPKEQRFCGLRTGRKRLVDTVKMIAYRSETSMIPLLTGPTVNTADARRLLQNLFTSEADIFPETEKKLLRIRVHNASRPAANRSLAKMFEKLKVLNPLPLLLLNTLLLALSRRKHGFDSHWDHQFVIELAKCI
jgi:hypothetical protein